MSSFVHHCALLCIIVKQVVRTLMQRTGHVNFSRHSDMHICSSKPGACGFHPSNYIYDRLYISYPSNFAALCAAAELKPRL